jgi:hypothetical protein
VMVVQEVVDFSGKAVDQLLLAVNGDSGDPG